MIEVQRQLKNEDKTHRAFEILNLGKYERSYFVSGNDDLNDEQNLKDENNRELAFNGLILQAYNADPIDGFRTFRGKHNDRLFAIGPLNLPLTRPYAEEVIAECLEKRITKADLLAFEFEMGLFPNIQDNAKEKGVDLVLKYIPIKEPTHERSTQAVCCQVLARTANSLISDLSVFGGTRFDNFAWEEDINPKEGPGGGGQQPFSHHGTYRIRSGRLEINLTERVPNEGLSRPD